MKSHEKIWTYVAIVIGVPMTLFALVSWYESRVSGLPVLGPEEHKVGYFSFVNQHNTNISPKSWDNKIVVAGFFFTHCPTVCPKMISNLKSVQAVADEHVSINTFTVDPERDNVERFRYYANRFGIAPGWNLLTGNKKELYRFARKELMIVATDGDGGPEDFIHSENFVLIDPDKRIRGYYQGTRKKDTDQLIRDISKLKREYSLD
jgi:protein SCO1/2